MHQYLHTCIYIYTSINIYISIYVHTNQFICIFIPIHILPRVPGALPGLLGGSVSMDEWLKTREIGFSMSKVATISPAPNSHVDDGADECDDDVVQERKGASLCGGVYGVKI